MRRVALTLTLGGCCLLMLLCGVGLLAARTTDMGDLVLSGAGDVRIDGHGAARFHITYDLPAAQTLHSLRNHMLQHGWQRVRAPNYDRSQLVFVRRSWLSVVREIAIVNADPPRRATAEISVARCIRVAGWSSCP